MPTPPPTLQYQVIIIVNQVINLGYSVESGMRVIVLLLKGETSRNPGHIFFCDIAVDHLAVHTAIPPFHHCTGAAPLHSTLAHFTHLRQERMGMAGSTFCACSLFVHDLCKPSPRCDERGPNSKKPKPKPPPETIPTKITCAETPSLRLGVFCDEAGLVSLATQQTFLSHAIILACRIFVNLCKNAAYATSASRGHPNYPHVHRRAIQKIQSYRFHSCG